MSNQGILVNLNISDDKMEAYLDLIPGGGGPESVDLAYIQSILEAQGVSFGVNEEALKTLAEKAAQKIRQDHVLVARGKMPVKGAPSYIRLKDRLFKSGNPKKADMDSHTVDYRMVSPFVMVQKGEPLGKKMDETEGTEGCNVFGEIVQPGKKEISQLEAGEHTHWKENIVYASVAGRFLLEKKVFSVTATLQIDGDVDYSTGHISFAGDVIIQGEIKDGFRVAAGGSVHIKKTLDASEVLCRKDLIIDGGIKGRNNGMVRVQGRVETRFIENCHLEAYEGLAVKSSILDSEVYSLGEVHVGEKKGALVGGILYAQKGLNTVNLGSQRNSHTRVHCGISFPHMRKLKHLQKRLEVLSLKMQNLRSLPDVPEHRELMEKAKKALEVLQRSIGKYVVDQYTDFAAEIRVRGTVFPGTHITICDREMNIVEKHDNVCIYYDKEKSRLAIKNLA